MAQQTSQTSTTVTVAKLNKEKKASRPGNKIQSPEADVSKGTTPSIDVLYALLWSKVGHLRPTDHVDGAVIHIVGECEPEQDGSYICGVDIRWHDLSCEMTCLFDPSTGQLLDFQLAEASSREITGRLGCIKVSMQAESAINGMAGPTKRELICDDIEHTLCHMSIDRGSKGDEPDITHIVGKRIFPWQRVGDVGLTKEEKERLLIFVEGAR